MVLQKGTQVTQDRRLGRSGVRGLKIFSDGENVKADANSPATARKSFRSMRKTVLIKGAISTTCNPKMRGCSGTMQKGTGKGSSTSGRKALADVSNVMSNSSRHLMLGSTNQKIAAGPCSRVLNVSSRKIITEKEKEKLSQGDSSGCTSGRGSIDVKDLKPTLDDQKTQSNNMKHASGTTRPSRVKSSHIPTRKSMPAFTRMTLADKNNSKEKECSSGEVRGTNGVNIVSKQVIPRTGSARSYLLRNRASDGFIPMYSATQNNADGRLLQRKSIKIQSTLKTTLRNSKSQKNSKCLVGPKTFLGSIPIKNEEVVPSSLSEIGASVASSEVKEEVSQATTSMVTATRKSNRRRSFTSLLVTRSKFLEERGETTEQEKLPRIDDGCNQLEVAEYVDDIYQYYWVTEAQNPVLENYLSIQPEITPHMRGILVNWLIEVHSKFDLMHETLYLTVALLDRYLSEVKIKKNEMQLVGLTSLLLASKYEDFWHPRIRDLISISAESYTREQILRTEKLMLRQLKFRLNTPTLYVFMLRFLKAAQSNRKFEHLAFYLIELCLVEYDALKFKPSLLCASAIYVARCTLQMTPSWTPLLSKHARYDMPQMRDCAEMILRFHKAAKTGRLKVTYEKYSKPDSSGVASIKPLAKLTF